MMFLQPNVPKNAKFLTMPFYPSPCGNLVDAGAIYQMCVRPAQIIVFNVFVVSRIAYACTACLGHICILHKLAGWMEHSHLGRATNQLQGDRRVGDTPGERKQKSWNNLKMTWNVACLYWRC